MIGVEFRFGVGQRLVESVRVKDPEALEYVGQRHARWAEQADEAGTVWFVEVVFDDGEHVRFGTDRGGMVLPVEVGRERLAEALAKRFADE